MRDVLLSALLAVFVAAAIAITCYDCDSLSDPHCSEAFDPKGIKQLDCNDTEALKYGNANANRELNGTGCLTKFHENPMIEGRYYIRRACYFGDLNNTKEACEAEDPVLPFPKILACEVCEEDLCNAGGGNGTVAI